jgi:hypothetical protein
LRQLVTAAEGTGGLDVMAKINRPFEEILRSAEQISMRNNSTLDPLPRYYQSMIAEQWRRWRVLHGEGQWLNLSEGYYPT